MFNIITIGSATIDAFVESDAADIVSVSTKHASTEFMSFPYGAKVEIDSFKTAVGGGGLNAAANLAHLGLKTSALFKIGDDFLGKNIKHKVKFSGVDISNIIESERSINFVSLSLNSR